MLEHLSERELEVVDLISQGLKNSAIAEHLSIETSTVETHVHHILGKLGMESRMEIMRWTFQGRHSPEEGEERPG